jgi:lipid II:glycine glycyltransferase (peptidoglycan interpeptide bridge formation enzyme)
MSFDPAKWDKQQVKRQASFLQSSSWGDFQKSLGVTPHYLMEKDWSCLVLEKNTVLGKYLMAPYGPTLRSPEFMKPAIGELKSYGKQTGAGWLRLEPMVSGSPSAGLKAGLSELGARAAIHNREPETTRIIDLTRGEDAILASISQSTRSLIRKNQRENFLSFKSTADPADIGLFVRMLDTVTKRNNV